MKFSSKDIDSSTKKSAAPHLRRKHIVIKCTPSWQKVLFMLSLFYLMIRC